MKPNLKPFDLEKALAGEPVETRDGRKVEQLHLFHADKDGLPLSGVLEGYICGWTTEGIKKLRSDNTPIESEDDLCMAPKEITYFLNVYKNTCGKVWVGNPCLTMEEAEIGHGRNTAFIETITFTVTE